MTRSLSCRTDWLVTLDWWSPPLLVVGRPRDTVDMLHVHHTRWSPVTLNGLFLDCPQRKHANFTQRPEPGLNWVSVAMSWTVNNLYVIKWPERHIIPDLTKWIEFNELDFFSNCTYSHEDRAYSDNHTGIHLTPPLKRNGLTDYWQEEQPQNSWDKVSDLIKVRSSSFRDKKYVTGAVDTG